MKSLTARSTLFYLLTAALACAFVSSTLLIAANAEAYIISAQTIANRTAHTHGKNPYVIDQDVTVTAADGSHLTVREHWLVETWEDMKLTVRESKAGDDSTLFVYRYRDGERTSNNSPANNGVRSVRPAEFFEPYFHARAGKSILDLFVRNGVLPPAILRHRVHPKADEPTNAAATMAPEPLVRLGRSDGAVQYVLGVATLAEAAQQNPGVWISQDSFMIHKIRFANEDELTVTKYAPPEGSLLFPAERTVKFGDRHAVIRLISVKPVTASVATQALNAPSAASASLERLTGPASAFEAAKEFYSRFR